VGWVRPKRGCLLSTLAYYAFPRWHEFGERRWNDIYRAKPNNSEKNLSNATLSTTNPTWIEPGANPGLRDERPATNNLSHGTTSLYTFFHISVIYGCKYCSQTRLVCALSFSLLVLLAWGATVSAEDMFHLQAFRAHNEFSTTSSCSGLRMKQFLLSSGAVTIGVIELIMQ
jgi:hypothetical protein